jgi:N-acetylmuramoyl-L-alanine amidase
VASDSRRRPPGSRYPRRRARLPLAVVLIIAVVVVAGVVAVSRKVGPFSTDPATTGLPLDPATFAAGACEAFGPTQGDNHKTVFLDAGHGGVDPGGIGSTRSGQAVHESTVNLAIELDAMALLRAHGYRVVVSRTEDTTVLRLTSVDTDQGVLSVQGSHDDVVARDTCANLAGADALVGLYMDAGASPTDAGSVTLYDTARTFSAANRHLATLVQADVLSAMNTQGWQIPDNGTLPDNGFGSSVGDPSAGGLASAAASYDHLLLIGPALSGYLSAPSSMPGAVIEPLYLTDPFEGTIAASPTDQQIIARGVAAAVEQFLEPTGTAPTTAPPGT